MATNSEKDVAVQEFLLSCANSFLGNDNRDKEDFYNVPLSAPPEWWKDIKVQKFGIVTGEFEIFRDDILALAKNIKVDHISERFWATNILNHSLTGPQPYDANSFRFKGGSR
jgi:hypothetical protein